MAQEGQVVRWGTVARVAGSYSWYRDNWFVQSVHRLLVGWERRGRLQVGQYVGRGGMVLSWSQTQVSTLMRWWSVVMSSEVGGLS